MYEIVYLKCKYIICVYLFIFANCCMVYQHKKYHYEELNAKDLFQPKTGCLLSFSGM